MCRMTYLYWSFSAKEPRARGDGALERAVAARPLDLTRVIGTVEIGECIEIGEYTPLFQQ